MEDVLSVIRNSSDFKSSDDFSHKRTRYYDQDEAYRQDNIYLQMSVFTIYTEHIFDLLGKSKNVKLDYYSDN